MARPNAFDLMVQAQVSIALDRVLADNAAKPCEGCGDGKECLPCAARRVITEKNRTAKGKGIA